MNAPTHIHPEDVVTGETTGEVKTEVKTEPTTNKTNPEGR